MTVFDRDGPCIAGYGQISDKIGDHSVGCASCGERIARHNYLRDALFNTAQSAHLGPLREERALLPGKERPADVLLPHDSGGKHQALDVCLVSSLQTQMIEGGANEPGFALTPSFMDEMRKYGDACSAEGIISSPYQ